MMETLVRVGIGAVAVLALATGCSDNGNAGSSAADVVTSVKAQLPAKPAPAQQVAAQPAQAQTASDAGSGVADEPSVTPVGDGPSISTAQPGVPIPAPEVTPVENPVDEGGNPCLDTSSDLVQNVIARMGPPPGSDYYAIGQHSSGTTPNCPTLMWAVAETPGGTGSSPENVLFFHDGKFQKFATPSPSAFTSIVGSTDDSLTVHYSWLVGDEPNSSPQGNAEITFMWDGSHVVSDNEVPPEVYNFG